MINRLLAFLISILICSCVDNTLGSKKTYFEYDKIEFFYSDINEDDLYNFVFTSDSLKSYNKKTESILNLITRRYPEKITNGLFLNELKDCNYSKTVIKERDFDFINEIFKENNCEDGVVFACAPVYRDVLVFYESDKIVGIAKICFDCRQSYIIGTDKNVGNFGHCGDFEKLKEFLEKYSK